MRNIFVKNTFRKVFIYVFAIFMAVVMASVGTLQVFAAGRGDRKTGGKVNSGKRYVKDVIIVTASESYNLAGTPYSDYVVLRNNPIKDFSDGDSHEDLYFAVLPTDDPNESLTDIKAMNMNGDYDYDAYGKYLADVEKWALAKADTTMTAIKEFKANYKAGKPSAVFAYNMLNYLVGDYEDVPLGDVFTDDEYAQALGMQVKNIVMKANIATLTYIRQLLLLGCSETIKDDDFVNLILTHTESNPLIYSSDYDIYKTAAEDMMYSLDTTREAIKSYRAALAEHGDGLDAYIDERNAAIDAVMSDKDKFGSDEYKEADKELSSIKSIVSGRLLTTMFDVAFYVGNDGKKMTVTDILVKDIDAEKEEDKLTLNMVLPIVAQMSDGQRALAGCGFDTLVASVINDYSEENSEYEKSLGEIRDFWDTISEDALISVYAGVDLSLFDPNGIAMVGKDGEFLSKAQGDYSFLGVSTLAAGMMAGGAVVSLAGSCALLKTSMKWIQNEPVYGVNYDARWLNIEADLNSLHEQNAEWLEAFRNGIVEDQYDGTRLAYSLTKEENQAIYVRETRLGIERADIAPYLKAFSTFMIVLSVALLVFSIVTLVMNLVHKDDPQDYIQVPRVLVTVIETAEYDERYQKIIQNQMIFYKGIIDPFMSDKKAEEMKSPSKVMDVFDWSLKTKDREWIALYTTKDGRAGNPIIFDGAENTLAVLKKSSASDTYITLEQAKGFNGRVNIFNKENYTECGDGIIVFNSDPDVKSTTKTGLGASMDISNGAFVLFILIAATAGVGIGVGFCFLINKNRKKKAAEA